MSSRRGFREAAAAPSAYSVTATLLAAGGGEPRTGYIGAGLQGVFPSNAGLSSGLGLDVNYTANLAESFSVELSLAHASLDAGGIGPGAEFKILGLGAVAQFGKPFGAARWYAGAGLAYWMNDISGAAVTADDSVAFTVAAGADLPVVTTGDLCIELRYLLSDADLSTGSTLDLDSFGVRVNYVFKY